MPAYLHLLGGLRVDASDVAPSARALQRKRLALLAVLGASGRRWSRDKLIALLWPETTEERARHQLASSVYDLRSAFGETAVLSSGDDLSLNPDALDVDVAEFETAFAQSDFQRAISLYAGPFLDGFFLSDAVEFDQWVERERARLSQRFGEALERLAEQSEQAGERNDALAAWRRLAEHDPFNTRVAIRFMHALDAAGNRAAALQHAAAHRALLRNELGVEADASLFEEEARLRSFTETNPAAVLPAITGIPAGEQVVLQSAAYDERNWRTWLVASVILIVVVAALIYFAVRASQSPVVVMMDSPNPARVYDEEAVRANGTNADIINDLLSDLPIKRVKETAGPYWHRHQEIHDLDPDLIVIHLSAFCAAECEPRRVRMRQFVEYLADSDAEFLIYSRFPPDTLQMILRETFGDLLDGNPGLVNRIHAFPIRQFGPPRWRDPATGTALKMKVKEILDLR